MFEDDPTVSKAIWNKAESAIAAIEEEHGLDLAVNVGDQRHVAEVKHQSPTALPKEDGPYTLRIFHPDTGQLLITFDGGDPDEVRRVAIDAYRDLMTGSVEPAEGDDEQLEADSGA